MAIPDSMMTVCTYFDRATELQTSHPYVANRIRMFGMEQAMKLRHKDAGRYLMAQMEALEREKEAKLQPPFLPQPKPTAPASGNEPGSTAAPPEATGEDAKELKDLADSMKETKVDDSAPTDPAPASPDPVVPPAPPAAPPVRATPQQALRLLGLDLYERGRAVGWHAACDEA